jgi:hypothetical protein
MKQTAVEWLVDKVLQTNHLKAIFEDEINQAKEIEKQNVKNAYGSGIETMRKSFSVSSHIPKGSEEYYNETFNE